MYPEASQAISQATEDNKEAPESKDELYKELYTDVVTGLRGLEYDTAYRNEYMNKRYRAIYQDGIYHDIDIPSGEWFAEYNLVRRVVDIMTTQLFGRGFNMVSTYSKEDLSAYTDPTQKQEAQLKNKKLKADAALRMKAARGIIKDNGGMALFEDGGRVGSSLGLTAFKVYPDKKDKKVVISLLEKPQNLRLAWKRDNFREWDSAAYVYQISVDSANRDYGHLLKPGQTFQQGKLGFPLENIGLIDTTTVYGQLAQGQPVSTDRPMVTVVDFTGNLPGWAPDGKNSVKEVPHGQEKPFSLLCVGGVVGDIVTDESLLPKYYKIDNRWVPAQSYGESDISDSLIDINKEIVRLMRDMGVWADKNLWKILLGKGLTEEALVKLKGKSRTTKMLAVSPEQTIEEVETTSQPITEFAKLVDQKIDLFVRLAGVGRVLFDDPTVSANSNQALMTTLKGVVDAVESKQKRWNPELVAMFTDALFMAAPFIPGLDEALNDDPDWEFLVEWPSILRREDPAYQMMWLNLFNRGAVSAETFLQKAVPVYDTEEELDRIRDEMEDPVLSAMMGNLLGEMAHQTLNKALGIPPWGYVLPKVALKGELAPQEVGNMSHNFGWDQGPYGDAIGPTGMDGQIAADNFMNAGMLNGNPRDGGTANYQGPQGGGQQPQQANPTLTPDQNTGQTASQPGSGAPAVSPAGAVAANNQQSGH